MNYQETLEWMFQQLPMYQTQGATAYKANLNNIIALSNHLGNPEQSLKTIHIAGTNGKGSTSSMISSILQEAGYQVGLYTSPHLKDFRERIKINNKEIDEEYVITFISKHRNFLEKNSLSFFEMTVGMAFQYFFDKKVDYAVIEVGMGGRLDATNIINPMLSVITNIGMDHTAFLGDTLEKIANEKAGIIKDNTPIVIGQSTVETKKVFDEIASLKKAPIFYSDLAKTDEYPTDLKGAYQKFNQKTVITAIEVLQQSGKIQCSTKAIKAGMENVQQNTGLKGRWQIIKESPLVIADTAHNEDGLKNTMEQLSGIIRKKHIIFGMMADKNTDKILDLLPKNAIYYFCAPKNNRALDVLTLLKQAQSHGLNGNAYNSVAEAYENALTKCEVNDCIYIGGSTFVVAEIL